MDDAGVLLHQFDDWEDPSAPWSPCPAKGGSGVCGRVDSLTRRDRVSTSMIYAGMKRHDRPDRNVIPLFSRRGGVILRPETTKVLCAYGIDAGIDYGSDKGANCRVATSGSECIPGCGNPPEWCTETGLIGGWCRCSFAWSCGTQNSPRPYRPEDLGAMLENHASFGDQFKGIGTFSGYNELIVESATWIENLPRSIEAFFTVAGGDEAFARRAHSDFVQRYGAEIAPLVQLRPDRWSEPFAVL